MSPERTPAVAVLDRTGALVDLVVRAQERLADADVHELARGDLNPSVTDLPPLDVLVLGPRECTAAGLRRLGRWHAAHPATSVVAFVPPDDAAPDRAALKAAGVRVIVRGAPTLTRVTSALAKAAAHAALLAQTARAVPTSRELEPAPPDVADPPAELEPDSDPEPGSEPETGSEPEPVLADEHADEPALVLTVASATGGCGKTFFATNAAALLASTGLQVLLVDMDLQFGEVAAALQVRHPYSVYDGLYDAKGAPLPQQDLADHLHELVHHHALGFDVLTAPREPSLADYVGAADAVRVLDVVTERYDVVLVDTPPTLNEVVLTALDRSDIVVVMATLDVPSLKNLTVFLDTMRRLQLDDSVVRLVMNKVEPDVGIDMAQVQQAFDSRFLAGIPQSRAVSRSINAGTVVVTHDPRSDVTRSLRAAMSAIVPASIAGHLAAPPPPPSLWTRLLGLLGRRPAPPALKSGEPT